MFLNRSDAGRQLVVRLKQYQNHSAVVMAVPRGGVSVAYEIARAIRLPMEVILVKKIGHPLNEEYAIGAVGLKHRYIVAHSHISAGYINQQTEMIRLRLQQIQSMFTGNLQSVGLKDKILIVVDDGIATGNTLLATVHILRKELPKKIVIAVPVASKSAIIKLSGEVDEFISLLMPDNFINVSSFYDDFSEVSDEEVIAIIQRLGKNG